jgi:hypothetical protein
MGRNTEPPLKVGHLHHDKLTGEVEYCSCKSYVVASGVQYATCPVCGKPFDMPRCLCGSLVVLGERRCNLCGTLYPGCDPEPATDQHGSLLEFLAFLLLLIINSGGPGLGMVLGKGLTMTLDKFSAKYLLSYQAFILGVTIFGISALAWAVCWFIPKRTDARQPLSLKISDQSKVTESQSQCDANPEFPTDLCCQLKRSVLDCRRANATNSL